MPKKFNNTIPLIEGEELDTSNSIFSDFNSSINPREWLIAAAIWGTNNNGVHPKNIQLAKSCVQIYSGGEKNPSDEFKLTGGVLVSNFNVQPGRYEARVLLPKTIGQIFAMWLYTETDASTNHEIDLETPCSSNINEEASFNQILIGTYKGLSNHSSKIVKINKELNDGNFHTFGFDWYYSTNNKLIRFYIDNVIIGEITDNIPNVINKLWIGSWVPNKKDLGGLANNKIEDYTEIDYISYTPFKNQITVEHNPSAGNVAHDYEYPTEIQSNEIPRIVKINGKTINKINNKFVHKINNWFVDNSQDKDIIVL